MKVAFLDRDGVINREVNYLYKVDDFEFTQNCVEGLKRLIEHGYQIIIVTNQAGIARGFYTEHDYEVLTAWYCAELLKYGIEILDVFYCPHHPEGSVTELSIECRCRKPNIGMLELAASKYQINIEESILIGDKESDLLAGTAFGLVKVFMVETGHSIDVKHYDTYNIFEDLSLVPL
ncbi:D-glycero-alpha-D-manno-heptose-1,7-bisphosphate 7-phosphatase [Vibrio aestuarianus]|uniref:D-glycero-alpha-D-manno-heptose-1,7-bisphosphate 7-phosphatase n=1 Tax=Vibrio aestuarianus TaxID=28171 RepID=UPI0040683944